MNEYLAGEHRSDLLREAAAHNRFASRAARAECREPQRHHTVRLPSLRRHASAIGCEA